MKRLLTLILVVALLGSSVPVRLSAAQAANGTITGLISSPSGPLGGVTVNIIDNAGTVAGTTVTSGTGAYTVGSLAPGRYTVQLVDQAGRVLSTGTGVVAANAPAVTVNMALTASQLAGTASAASAGGLFGLSAVKVLAIAAAAGAGITTAVVVQDSSPNR